MNRIQFVRFTDSEFELVKKIRETVFTIEQGAEAGKDIDEYDKEALFAILYVDETAAATARLVKTENGYKIGRIAVLKNFRGLGLGAQIVRCVTEKGFATGTDYILVDAQNYAVPFYEKLGFRAVGAQIMDRGLPHIPMKLERGDFCNGKKERV